MIADSETNLDEGVETVDLTMRRPLSSEDRTVFQLQESMHYRRQCRQKSSDMNENDS